MLNVSVRNTVGERWKPTFITIGDFDSNMYFVLFILKLILKKTSRGFLLLGDSFRGESMGSHAEPHVEITLDSSRETGGTGKIVVLVLWQMGSLKAQREFWICLLLDFLRLSTEDRGGFTELGDNTNKLATALLWWWVSFTAPSQPPPPFLTISNECRIVFRIHCYHTELHPAAAVCWRTLIQWFRDDFSD